MNFNTNHTVKVKLTPVGRKMIRDQYTKACEECSVLSKTWDPVPKEDEFGYSEWQFHDLISILGSKMFCVGNAKYSAIEPNIMFEVRENVYK